MSDSDLGELKIKLGADIKEALEALRAIQGQLKDTGEHTEKASGALEKLANIEIGHLLVDAFREIKDVVMEASKAFAENEQAFRKVQAVTNTFDGARKFEELATSLSDVSTNSIDANMNAVAMLGKFELTDASIAKLLPRLNDFAAFMGEDIADSANKFGMAISSGEVNTRRLGIAMDDSEKAMFKSADTTERTNMLMEKLAKFHGQAAEQAKTADGSHKQYTNQLDEMNAALGRIIDKPMASFWRTMADGAKEATSSLEKMAGIFDSKQGFAEWLLGDIYKKAGAHLPGENSVLAPGNGLYDKPQEGLGTVLADAAQTAGFSTQSKWPGKYDGMMHDLGHFQKDTNFDVEDAGMIALRLAAGETAESLRQLATQATIDKAAKMNEAQLDAEEAEAKQELAQMARQEAIDKAYNAQTAASSLKSFVSEVEASQAKVAKSSLEFTLLSIGEALHGFGQALVTASQAAVSTMYQKQNAEQGFAQSQFDLQQQARQAKTPFERAQFEHQIDQNNKRHERDQDEQGRARNAGTAGKLLTGDYMGAAVDLITQTKGFARIMDTLGGVISLAMKVIEPVIDFIASTFDLLRRAYNAVVDTIANIVNKFFTDSAGDEVRKWKIPAARAADGLDTFADNLNKANAATMNVPQIFKTAYQNFASRSPGQPGAPKERGKETFEMPKDARGQLTTLVDAAKVGGQIHISGPITVTSPVDSVKKLVAAVKDQANKEAYGASGMPNVGQTIRQFYGAG